MKLINILLGVRHISEHVIIFARYPVQGRVKRRLAASIGDNAAYSVYTQCLDYVLSEVGEISDCITHVAVADPSTVISMQERYGNRFRYFGQQGEDIGERMKYAFEDVFSSGAAKAILIGTDIPDITKELLQDALLALDSHDVVIGAAADGGYYLIGTNRYRPELFDSISWSTTGVYRETASRIKKQALFCKVMPVLNDIDTMHDLTKWYKTNDEGSEHPLYRYLRQNAHIILPFIEE